jgi:hypothetical protein
MEENKQKTYKKICEFHEKQYKQLLERSKTEPISFVEILKPLQMIYNYTVIEFENYMHNKTSKDKNDI